MSMLFALSIQGQTVTLAPPISPSRFCDSHLCVKGRTLTGLPNYQWACATSGKPAFQIAISGPPIARQRNGLITSEKGFKLPSGVAENLYPPNALIIGGRTSIIENFDIADTKATYYLILTWEIDHPLDATSGEDLVLLKTASYQINIKPTGRAAKPFAVGQCSIVGASRS